MTSRRNAGCRRQRSTTTSPTRIRCCAARARHNEVALPARRGARRSSAASSGAIAILRGRDGAVFERYRWAWIAASTTFWSDPKIRARRERIGWRDRYEQLVRDILQAGIDAGEIRALDVPVAGRMILGAVN
ncbi:hypothetical protein ACFQU2_19950 [Siccirubricoccus deserti]